MRPSSFRSTASWLPGVLLLAVPAFAGAQQDAREQPEDPRLAVLQAETYMTPPDDVMGAVLASAREEIRFANLEPSGRYFLRSVGDGFPSIDIFSKPYYNLGQFHVDFRANRIRSLTTRSDVAIEVYSRDGTRVSEVEVPNGARVSGASFSPDGSRVAFLAHFDDATHIFVADSESGDSRQLTRTPLLATHVTSFIWTEDGEHIVAVLLPSDRGPEPPRPQVPESPLVRITSPDQNALRTYFDLLEDPYEKELVHYYSTGQLARIEVDSRDVELIGEPAMIEDVDVSPDGAYFRVTTMKPELSYVVPTSSAGSIEEIWNLEGEALAVLDESELNEQVRAAGGGGGGGGGGGNDDDEKRGLRWRPDGQPGMVFLQQGPEPEDDDEERTDRVMHWLPPFDETSTEVVYESETEIQSVAFDRTGRVLFLTREEDETETVHMVSLDDPSRQEYLVYEDDGEDELNPVGSLMTDRGAVRMSSDGRYVYLQGTQRFEDPIQNAPRPFVDRVEIRTGAKERVFQSAADVYETVSVVLDDDLSEMIIARESASMYPNQWRVSLATGARTQVTFNEDPNPRLTAARRETVMVTRPDGFQSRVSVTLPDNWNGREPLPAMFWFYPSEYTDQEDYDEGLESFNKNDFPSIGARSMDILTLLGYAVVEPDLPIVGPEGQMNDEYPHDLRVTLAAVIDSLSSRGWIDRNRLGLGGHSYGAFSTANAMIQTPFFKAGIAGDGNYNRSLTPAGFQTERRDLWEAQDLYIEMSPFFQADRLTGALLMYHGMDDHNVGTHPIHADRMIHALEVLGKTAALYKYPFEDHGPATLQTNLDLWARWIAWLDLYVKNAGRQPLATVSDDASDG